MEIFHLSSLSFCLWFSPFFVLFSTAQLSPSETKILIQIQQILEYPEPLHQPWSSSTNFCNLPITLCSGTHLTELTIIGNRTKPISKMFSINSFFTVLTKLSNLRSLKLVRLGIWGGPLPAMITRLKSLQILDMSSNFIIGEMPESIGRMTSLRRLSLSVNSFNGSIPDLSRMKGLEDLDLGHNHLGPNFPSLPSNLVNVTLRNNSLRSVIPEEVRNLNLIRMFDLSSNKLLGPIPSFLLSLPSIQNLNLADNRLSGTLPLNISCSSNLTHLDISKNLLIGQLPICFRGNNSANRTVLSSWNCFSGGTRYMQHSYSYCNKQALAVEPRKEKSNVKIGLIIGIIGVVVGTAIVFVGLVVLILGVSLRKRENHVSKKDNIVLEKGHGHVPRTMRLTSLLPPYNVFTLEEMEDATNNFDSSNLVGELGLQGQIYKGWLRDGSRVLVRCLKIKEKISPQSLQQQMEVISKLRHRHLVSVLGHCIATYQNQNQSTTNTASTVFIVMEYMANGSLRDHLSEWAKRDMLKWPQRMGMMMGIAKGVEFLHSGIAPAIFGNGLRIDNVLLDDTLSPKLTSYKIPLSSSKLGIRDENGEKDDIYQLGSILLQLLTGKVIQSKGELNILKIEVESSLAESVMRLREVIDPSIRGSFTYDSIKTAVEISLKCVCEDPNGRPNIEDFLWHMQYSLQVQQGWTTSSSGNLNTMI